MNLRKWIKEQYARLGYEVETSGYSSEEIRQWAQSLWRWLQQNTAWALVMVESGGDPYAHREGSQFRGMLQMGHAAATDVGIDDNMVLHGNPDLALKAFWDYQRRYVGRTDGVPLWMAVLWHEGPGNLRKIRKEYERTGDLDAAFAVGFDALPEYIRRYRMWMASIAEGYDVQNAIRAHMSVQPPGSGI